MHPSSYKLYKVLLLDTNVQLRGLEKSEEEMLDPVLLELFSVGEDIKDSLSKIYEERIRAIIKEMEATMTRV